MKRSSPSDRRVFQYGNDNSGRQRTKASDMAGSIGNQELQSTPMWTKFHLRPRLPASCRQSASFVQIQHANAVRGAWVLQSCSLAIVVSYLDAFGILSLLLWCSSVQRVPFLPPAPLFVTRMSRTRMEVQMCPGRAMFSRKEATGVKGPVRNRKREGETFFNASCFCSESPPPMHRWHHSPRYVVPISSRRRKALR